MLFSRHMALSCEIRMDSSSDTWMPVEPSWNDSSREMFEAEACSNQHSFLLVGGLLR